MAQYYIKVRTCDTNQEAEYWSKQIVSPTQANLFYNVGNVGIGSPNPLGTLTVDGNVGIGTDFSTFAPPTDGLIVSGSVGIGTSTPIEKLHVAGNALIAGFIKQELSTLTATPQVGTLEYDGLFFGSPSVTHRGVLPAEATYVLSANRVLLTSTAVQSFFPAAYSMASATTYKFKAVINMSRTLGTTSHTIGTSVGGTATFTGIQYAISSTVANGGAPVLEWIANTANTTITAANAVATENNTFLIDGIARVNVGGTFILQFTYSAAPGGLPTIAAGSWISFYPIGDNTVTAVGDTWV